MRGWGDEAKISPHGENGVEGGGRMIPLTDGIYIVGGWGIIPVGSSVSWSRIHEHIILLRFLGITLRVLRLEVSVYNVYLTNQFQTTFSQGGRGGREWNSLVEVIVNIKKKTLKTFNLSTSKNSASGCNLSELVSGIKWPLCTKCTFFVNFFLAVENIFI